MFFLLVCGLVTLYMSGINKSRSSFGYVLILPAFGTSLAAQQRAKAAKAKRTEIVHAIERKTGAIDAKINFGVVEIHVSRTVPFNKKCKNSKISLFSEFACFRDVS